MKILINRKPIIGPYGGGNLFVKAFCEYFTKLGHEIVHAFSPNIKLILMIDPRYDELGVSYKEILGYKQYYNPAVKIIHRVNENDLRKKTTDVDPLLAVGIQVEGTHPSQFFLIHCPDRAAI